MKLTWILSGLVIAAGMAAGEPVEICPALQMNSGARIKVENVHTEFGTDYDASSVFVSVDLPRISGSIYPEGERRFRAEMDAELEWEKQLFEDYSHQGGDDEETGMGASSASEVEIRPVNGRFLTVSRRTRSDGMGAHSYGSSEVYTYDLKSGKRVKFRDLGIPEKPLREKIEQRCGDEPGPEKSCDLDPICMIPPPDEETEDEAPKDESDSHEIWADNKDIVLSLKGILVSQRTDWYSYCARDCSESGEPDFTYEELQKFLPASSPLKPFVDMIVKIPVARRARKVKPPSTLSWGPEPKPEPPDPFFKLASAPNP